MQKKTQKQRTTSPQGNGRAAPVGATPVNKEAFRMLALENGLNAACRKLDVPIPTGKSWARRGGWKLPKRPGGRPGSALTASSASSLHPIADALVATHKELESTTKTALMQTAARAAEHASTPPPLEVSNPSQLRDLGGAAAKLFGWDAKDQSGDTYNTLVITREQLQEIRALREQALREQAEDQE
jgi:hypothetical protein